VFTWYLRTRRGPLFWKAHAELDRLSSAGEQIWCFHYSDPRKSRYHAERGDVRADGWKLAAEYPYSFILVPRAHFPYTLLPTQEPNQVSRCTLSCWKRPVEFASSGQR
jgi:hypothetical protein